MTGRVERSYHTDTFLLFVQLYSPPPDHWKSREKANAVLGKPECGWVYVWMDWLFVIFSGVAL